MTYLRALGEEYVRSDSRVRPTKFDLQSPIRPPSRGDNIYCCIIYSWHCKVDKVIMGHSHGREVSSEWLSSHSAEPQVSEPRPGQRTPGAHCREHLREVELHPNIPRRPPIQSPTASRLPLKCLSVFHGRNNMEVSVPTVCLRCC